MARAIFCGLVLLGLGACEEPALKGLEGRWKGTITCYNATAELTMSVTAEGAQLVGSGQTRFKDHNKSWEVKARSATGCQEDSCRSDRDCPRAYDPYSDADIDEPRKCSVNPTCQQKCSGADGGNCNPCTNCKPCMLCEGCSPGWLPIKVSLADDEVVLNDPELKLWRIGNSLLRGSVENFCPDEKIQYPEVELNKD